MIRQKRIFRLGTNRVLIEHDVRRDSPLPLIPMVPAPEFVNHHLYYQPRLCGALDSTPVVFYDMAFFAIKPISGASILRDGNALHITQLPDNDVYSQMEDIQFGYDRELRYAASRVGDTPM